jgi:hypothetical protein
MDINKFKLVVIFFLYNFNLQSIDNNPRRIDDSLYKYILSPIYNLRRNVINYFSPKEIDESVYLNNSKTLKESVDQQIENIKMQKEYLDKVSKILENLEEDPITFLKRETNDSNIISKQLILDNFNHLFKLNGNYNEIKDQIEKNKKLIKDKERKLNDLITSQIEKYENNNFESVPFYKTNKFLLGAGIFTAGSLMYFYLKNKNKKKSKK